MAHSKSAAKRLRQSFKRRMFNRMRKSRIKTSENTNENQGRGQGRRERTARQMLFRA